MTTIKKRAVMSLALGSLMTVVIVSGALATHPRPSTGTPFRVPFVPAYEECTSPNSKHVAPLAFGSCTPPSQTSGILTTGSGAGLGSGFGNLRVFCSNGQIPECPATGSQLDIAVDAVLSDVRCADGTGGLPGCSVDGADYTGFVAGESVIRITDHSNPGIECPNGAGTTPCTAATVQDITFGVPVSCVADTGGGAGGDCSLSTTINTLAPTTVKERQRGVVEVFNLHINDAGPDGVIDDGVTTPLDPLPCPPDCSTGDEDLYQNQGIFIP